MGKIFMLLGKSGSGKDSVMGEILHRMPELKRVIPCTTRPVRPGEKQGDPYWFITEKKFRFLKDMDGFLETREYQTVSGTWRYGTERDAIDPESGSYLTIGTPDVLRAFRKGYPADTVPVYLITPAATRMERSLKRLRDGGHVPSDTGVLEIARRMLADEKDFNEKDLEILGVWKDCRFANLDGGFEDCVGQVMEYIRKEENRR